MWSKLKKLFRNFYFLSILFFLLWMIFLDSNDLISRFRLGTKAGALENEKEYYLQKIEEVDEDRHALFGNPESLEKFAREKYLMKKETEEVFIVVEE